MLLANDEVLGGRVLGIISSLLSIIGLVQLLDSVDFSFAYMSNRIWVTTVFNLGFNTITLQSLLLLVWLVYGVVVIRDRRGLLVVSSVVLVPFLGVEAAVSVASLLSGVVSIIDLRRRRVFLLTLFVSVSVFEFGALLHWIFFYPLGIHNPVGFIAGLEAQLYFAFGMFTPYIGLTMIFVCILNVVWNLFIRREFPKVRVVENDRTEFSNELRIFIAFILFLSIIASLYPYIPTVNPQGIDAGQDVRLYLEWAANVDEDPSQVLNFIRGARPMILLTIYGFQKVTGLEALAAIRFLPIILNPLMVLTLFFLVLEASQDNWFAAISAFFTATGYPITVNMSSYFLTNALGLSFAFLSLGFLMRRIRLRDRKCLVFAVFFGALLIFTHPWTFDQFYVPFLIISILIAFFTRSERFDQALVLDVFIYTILLGVVDLLKALLFRGFSGVAASATALSRLTTLSSFWADTAVSFTIMFGGLYSNLLLLGLAILGILVSRSKGFFEHYLEIFLGLSSLVFLVGDSTIKSRIFYNLPIGFLAAIGFLNVYRSGDRSYSLNFAYMVTIAMLVYFFRSLANIV